MDIRLNGNEKGALTTFAEMLQNRDTYGIQGPRGDVGDRINLRSVDVGH